VVTDAVEALLADPAAALIALDFDGTLAPIVDRPQDARLGEGGLKVLQQLSRRIGQLAVVSGRGAAEVVELGGLAAVPGLRVMGHYGLQRWYAGELSTPAPEPGVGLARTRLAVVLADAPGGVWVEDKEHSVAVHTRSAAAPQRTLDDLTPALLDLAEIAGLEAVPGRFVLELRPPGVDKGRALRELVAAAEARTVIYIGDDVGDLPAFRVVTDLRAAGVIAGLSVVAVSADAEVPAVLRESADLQLPGPEGVIAWLAGIAGLLPTV
jgi:trehalose 6-phosphate phosphatase